MSDLKKYRWIKVYDFEINGPEPQQRGSTRVINIDGKRLCLARNDEGYFAMDNRCPHAGAHLGEGWCENGHVVCPVHRFKYDVKTGRGAAGQGDFVKTHPTKEEHDGLYIGLPKRKWWQIW